MSRSYPTNDTVTLSRRTILEPRLGRGHEKAYASLQLNCMTSVVFPGPGAEKTGLRELTIDYNLRFQADGTDCLLLSWLQRVGFTKLKIESVVVW